jgi:phosphoenolpyruvate phosphomutase
LLIVPTTYYSTPVEVFERAGIRLVIWANHNVRASITAMQALSRRVFRERSVLNVEDQIAPVSEVFRLQNADELLEAEERYLPRNGQAPRAIILAASQGSELGDLTRSRPKAMLNINGRPLLHKLVSQFQNERVKEVVVVRGFGRDEVNAPGAQFVDNEEFEGTGELLSLSKAMSALEGTVVISFGDILFRKYILQNLLADPGDITIAVDAAWQQRHRAENYLDYIRATHPYSPGYHEEEPALTDIGDHLRLEEVHGEWIGLLKATAKGTACIRDALGELQGHENFKTMRFNELFRQLLARGTSIRVLYITGHWLDVDKLEDLTAANAF